METKDYRLCGGTLFALLNQIKRSTRITSSKQEPEVVSDDVLLKNFIAVYNPDFSEPIGSSFKTITNKFKTCQTCNSNYLPFNDSNFIKLFNAEYVENYVDIVCRVGDFINKYIQPKTLSWLASALIELIECDSSITANTVIYKELDNTEYKKEDLACIKEITMQTFLAGILHYILNNCPDNSIGEDTFKAWHRKPETKGARYEFNSDIGHNTKRTIGLIELVDRDAMRMRRLYPVSSGTEIHVEKNGEKSSIYAVPSQLITPKDEYSVYLNATREKYSKMRTLLYNDEPRNFYDFYVPNDIVRRTPRKINGKYEYTNVTLDYLLRLYDFRFCIVTGTGGLGKSMLMRHILLTAIGRYDVYNFVPVFIPLKDYDGSIPNIFDFIYSKYKNLAGAKDKNGLIQLLKYGKCLLLLDGLDEINSSILPTFERQLEEFIDLYSRGKVIISSRPASDFLAFSRFSVFNLQPLTLEKALELIDKLEFRPDEPEFKQKFRSALKSKLYYSQREFAENPLLLTIMLMTFEQYGEIPSKMHVFYREAYSALAQKHDANKGGYKRKFETGLSPDEFSNYFSEFCAQTYFKEMYELSDDEFDRVFSNMNIVKAGSSVKSSDFKTDLINALCLMFYESTKYHFTHRSFQEYFCALFFSKQKDKTLAGIGNFFEGKKTRTYSDKTFAMLYDMIPEKIEEYIFLPLLEQLINDCEAKDGYTTFLETMYPTIIYDNGDTPDIVFNTPKSYIYSFIINNFFKREYTIDDLIYPFVEEFVTDELILIEEDWDLDEYERRRFRKDDEVHYKMISKNKLDVAYYQNHDEPDTIGFLLEFEPGNVLRNRDKYPELYAFITDSSYPLVEEYQFIKDYYNTLFQKAKLSEADNLFDSFI